MTLSSVSIPTTVTPLSYLHERHHKQVRCRKRDLRLAMAHLAARAFLHSVPGRADSPVFDSVVTPVGQVTLMLLNRWQNDLPANLSRETIYVRGYTARFDIRSGLTVWDSGGESFAFDLAKRIETHPTLYTPPRRNLAVLRTALDLDREMARRSSIAFEDATRPSLPPTLLAFPRWVAIEPRLTRLAAAHASRRGMGWRSAWMELRDRLRVPDEFNDTGYELIDVTLCGSDIWPKAVGAYHDMRGFVDRAFYNAARDLPASCDGASPEDLTTFRGHIAPDLARWCGDDDIRRALAHRDQPFVIEGMSRLEVWLPQSHLGPAAFRYCEHGHQVDLWSHNPLWQPPAPGSPAPGSPAPAPGSVHGGFRALVPAMVGNVQVTGAAARVQVEDATQSIETDDASADAETHSVSTTAAA